MTYVSTPADWRDLARQVQNEKDPQKMVELAQQLVARLDEEIGKATPSPIGA